MKRPRARARADRDWVRTADGSRDAALSIKRRTQQRELDARRHVLAKANNVHQSLLFSAVSAHKRQMHRRTLRSTSHSMSMTLSVVRRRKTKYLCHHHVRSGVSSLRVHACARCSRQSFPNKPIKQTNAHGHVHDAHTCKAEDHIADVQRHERQHDLEHVRQCRQRVRLSRRRRRSVFAVAVVLVAREALPEALETHERADAHHRERVLDGAERVQRSPLVRREHDLCEHVHGECAAEVERAGPEHRE